MERGCPKCRYSRRGCKQCSDPTFVASPAILKRREQLAVLQAQNPRKNIKAKTRRKVTTTAINPTGEGLEGAGRKRTNSAGTSAELPPADVSPPKSTAPQLAAGGTNENGVLGIFQLAPPVRSYVVGPAASRGAAALEELRALAADQGRVVSATMSCTVMQVGEATTISFRDGAASGPAEPTSLQELLMMLPAGPKPIAADSDSHAPDSTVTSQLRDVACALQLPAPRGDVRDDPNYTSTASLRAASDSAAGIATRPPSLLPQQIPGQLHRYERPVSAASDSYATNLSDIFSNLSDKVCVEAHPSPNSKPPRTHIVKLTKRAADVATDEAHYIICHVSHSGHILPPSSCSGAQNITHKNEGIGHSAVRPVRQNAPPPAATLLGLRSRKLSGAASPALSDRLPVESDCQLAHRPQPQQRRQQPPRDAKTRALIPPQLPALKRSGCQTGPGCLTGLDCLTAATAQHSVKILRGASLRQPWDQTRHTGANDRGEARMLSKGRQQLPADSGSGGGKQKRAAGVETRSGSGDSKRLKLLAQSAEVASAKERNEPYLAGGLPARDKRQAVKGHCQAGSADIGPPEMSSCTEAILPVTSETLSDKRPGSGGAHLCPEAKDATKATNCHVGHVRRRHSSTNLFGSARSSSSSSSSSSSRRRSIGGGGCDRGGVADRCQAGLQDDETMAAEHARPNTKKGQEIAKRGPPPSVIGGGRTSSDPPKTKVMARQKAHRLPHHLSEGMAKAAAPRRLRKLSSFPSTPLPPSPYSLPPLATTQRSRAGSTHPGGINPANEAIKGRFEEKVPGRTSPERLRSAADSSRDAPINRYNDTGVALDENYQPTISQHDSRAHSPTAPPQSPPALPQDSTSTDFQARLRANMEARRVEKEKAGPSPQASPLAKSVRQSRTAGRMLIQGDPRVSTWEPPASPYGLLEEQLWEEPWRVLIACLLLNKTSAVSVRQVIWYLFRTFPNAAALANADVAVVATMVASLGLQKTRGPTLIRFSAEYLSRNWSHPEELHGIGKYGADAYFMFCRRDAWRQLCPCDKDLKKYWEFLKATDGQGQGLTRDAVPATV